MYVYVHVYMHMYIYKCIYIYIYTCVLYMYTYVSDKVIIRGNIIMGKYGKYLYFLEKLRVN